MVMCCKSNFDFLLPFNGQISFDDDFDSQAIYIVFLIRLVTRAVKRNNWRSQWREIPHLNAAVFETITVH